jgi:predicted alpha/beta-hydrolase family hydrolase
MLRGVTPITLRVAGREVSASEHGAGTTTLLLGHGAGGNRETPFLLRLAGSFAASGRRVVLFNFPYSEARRRIPDPPALLEATVVAVADEVRRRGARHLVLGGKSMGGRIASQAVAKGLAADALVFFGYPLHAPGKEGQLRDAHLPQIAAPMLFLQGTRDAFARFDLIEAVTGRLAPRAQLVRIEGADHGYKVPRALGETPASVEARLVAETERFLAALGF